MKIVVIGGTGLIGSKMVERLRQKGHEVLAASPNSGVNRITGEGLTEALAGTQVVIDVVRGQGSPGVLRDVRPKPARGRKGSRRGASHRPFDRRYRTPAEERLHARQAHGMCTTNADTVNPDLLAFIRS